jgi:8-oxo-dGTP pyrophosphatase MutT (NUDIX family)
VTGEHEPPDEPPRKRRRRRRPTGRPAAPGTGTGTGKPASAGAGKPAGGDGGAQKANPPLASGATPKRARRRPRHKPVAGKAPVAETPAAGKTPAAGATRNAKRRSKGSEPRIRTTREVSAGGVVYRRGEDGEIQVVLASRRTRRGDLAWGLAKGGIEDGETKEQAAIREVREETGLTATIEADLGDTRYIYVWEDVRIRKTVHFFLMRCTGGDVEDRDDEMEEIRWFPLERAMKRAAYRGERDVLGRAEDLLR